MFARTALALALAATASPALADAVTYWGKLGSSDIVLELSMDYGDANDTVVGRYFYAKKGIDIPLHAVEAGPNKLVLFEELPCTPEICEPAFESDTLPDALKGGVWTLTSEDGTNLTGTWAAKPDAKPVPIELGLFGTRPLGMSEPARPLLMSGLPYEVFEGRVEFTHLNFPYDYLKATSLDPEATADITDNGVTYRYLMDPRAKFPFPQIVDIDGSPAGVELANQRLMSRRNALIVSALDCEAQAYLGMGWMPGTPDWLGSYGGYPDEQVSVLYLSPTVMSWSESGSLYCGGAYPENHTYLTTIDMQTGRDLDLSRIFADSQMGAYRWEPGQSLIDLAISRRVVSDDAEFEEQCGMNELIASNLAVTFRPGDIAVFTLQGLPHVIQACQEDIFETPLAELKDYLAPTAAEYFPSLKG